MRDTWKKGLFIMWYEIAYCAKDLGAGGRRKFPLTAETK